MRLHVNHMQGNSPEIRASLQIINSLNERREAKTGHSATF